MEWSFVLAVIFVMFTVVGPEFAVCQQTVSQGRQDSDLSMNYLAKYGYLAPDDKHSGSLRTHDIVIDAIKRFQRMAGIEVTGILDDETLLMMKKPRCGVSDDVGNSNRARKKRYALHGSKWSKTDLTYKISQYSKKLTSQDTLSQIERAFSAWSKVTPLTFTRRDSGTVDIDIKFARSWHGDNNPFDGKGQTLAHAFFPQYGGDAHFDEDEPWTIGVPEGVNFFQVAVHEFGHSLGLAHSDVYSALMAPFYKGYQRDFSLGADDIDAVQALYGTPQSRRRPTPAPKPTPRPTPRPPIRRTPRPPIRRTPRPPIRRTPRPGIHPTLRPPRRPVVNSTPRSKPRRTPRPTPRPTHRPQSTKTPVLGIPEICVEPTFDAITRTKDGLTYVFKGKYHYRLNKYGIETGYPRLISTDWKGVHGPINAALTWENGYTYIFKGHYYWKFENRRLMYGPKRISYGFRGVPSNIDAAMVWGGNGKTYFFKGDQYWRYSGRRIDYGYPRPIRKWRGLPSSIQGAFKWENGRTYFFTGKSYYRYNDQLFSIDPTYPRPIATWWLGCPYQGSLTAFKDPYRQNEGVSESDSRDEQWLTVDNGQMKNQDHQWLTLDDDMDVMDDDNKRNGACPVHTSSISVVFTVSIFIMNFIL